MASTRYVFFSSSLLSSYCMVDVSWDDLGNGGWTLLVQDDEVSVSMSSTDPPPFSPIDSTAKGAFSVISVASATPVRTLPSFRSRVSRPRRMLNSTSERYATLANLPPP